MTIPQSLAVALVSGGLDSMVSAARAREEGHQLLALSIDYNQRHRVEIAAARRIAAALGAVEHIVLPIDLSAFGGSALTDDIAVPKDRAPNEMQNEIPITYVPGRNIIFLAHALAWGEVIGAADIFLGINAIDYSGYPDCRPDFLAAFEKMANLGTKSGCAGRPFSLHAPLQHLRKNEIIKLGLTLGVDYSLTHSCYDPQDGLACGRCDACRLRLQGFAEAGIVDPLRYVP